MGNSCRFGQWLGLQKQVSGFGGLGVRRYLGKDLCKLQLAVFKNFSHLIFL
ncbi:conserved protein of unknown function [Lactobacillus delbrueckii subsp. delbrueckii]|uniref:Uncharacterized protein n=1 Tax=Lactobacillus delbrueckii subsp. delbrueckii TaxID=83684 RepID=A0AAU9R6E6_9LACO|nr:hypothetical protein FC10_GL001374 [Lactobacillus delbrueckii subsp. lactis DSM 20072]CAH1707030.1 conserved protein of unknown function [Lactobacillus delbrueckii subsp. delbrueckii]